jgi:hypothetical protein
MKVHHCLHQRHFAALPSAADSDAHTFSGHWQGGLRHGSGILSFPGPGKNFYSGEWHEDQKHGWGIMQYPSGGYYEGEWIRDHKHGFGTMYWTESMERYRGNWWHNKPDGVGEHVWYRGAAGARDTRAALLRCNRYVGMFLDGHRHGEGTMQYASGTMLSSVTHQVLLHILAHMTECNVGL